MVRHLSPLIAQGDCECKVSRGKGAGYKTWTLAGWPCFSPARRLYGGLSPLPIFGVGMRPRVPMFLIAALFSCVQSGCGTMFNLWAPATSVNTGGDFILPNTCEPMGGVSRTAVLGAGGIYLGVAGIMQNPGPVKILEAIGLVTAGTAILVVDFPLSVAADVVTWPIANARHDGRPWATWWGQQSQPRQTGWEDFWQASDPQTSQMTPQQSVGAMPQPTGDLSTMPGDRQPSQKPDLPTP